MINRKRLEMSVFVIILSLLTLLPAAKAEDLYQNANSSTQTFLPVIRQSAADNSASTTSDLVTVAANQNIDAEAARTQILNGVSTLADPGGPGKMVVYGTTAYVIAGYAGSTLGDPMIAAAGFGNGKVIALPDHQWLEMNSYGNTGNTGQFYRNSIAWLAGTTSKTIKIVVTPNTSAKTWLTGQGYTNVIQSGNYATDLQGASLLIGWLGSSVTQANLDAVATFVRNGGGLLLADYGIGYSWWWNTPLPQTPGNRLLREVGIGFIGDWPNGAADITPTNRGVGQLTSADVLAMINLQGSYTAQQRRDGASILDGMYQVLPAGDSLLAQLDQAYLARINQLNPTPNTPITDGFDKAILRREGNLLQTIPVNQITAHRLAATLYGSVPITAPRLTQVVNLDTTQSRWLPTGLFVVPGEIVTVTAPAAMVGKGFRIRINAHDDDISPRSAWERPPLVHRSFVITQATMPIASAFGGLLFVDVGGTPPNLGTQSITVQNAVEAPYFVLGQHSDAQWLTTLRNRPAPFANFVSGNLMIAMPSRFVGNLQEPTALMTWWNQAVALQDDLAGQSRTSPELMNIDIQISAGAAHSGYPYQAYEKYWGNPADWNNLRLNGSWGDFHELGHNHQRGWWTFNGDGEVTVNIFSNYALETLTPHSTGGWSWSADPAQVIEEAVRNVQPGGTYASKSDRWSFWFQLADGFGWEPYRRIFRAYEQDNLTNPGTLPTSEQAKKDQWLVRYSQTVGYDMTRFMRDTWGLEVSQSAVNQISALPDWMPVIGRLRTINIARNSAYSYNLAANALSMDGVATLVNVSQPAHGVLVNNGAGLYTYTPTTNYLGVDSFFYTLQSSAGNTQTFPVAIHVLPDLIAWLRLNGNGQDESGNNNHAAIVGSVPFSIGLAGQAATFNGTPSNYLSFGTPSDLNFVAGSDFSVAFWIKSNGWPLNQHPVIIGNKNWSSGSNIGWLIAGRTDGKSWRWNYKASGSSRLDFNGGVIGDGRWHHIAVVHNRTGNATFYQDGVALGVVAMSANNGSLVSNLPTAIGQDGTLAYVEGLNALLDEVRIYRRVLTASEVAQLSQPNQPPVANNDSATLNAGSSATLAVLANDSDVDGDVLRVTALTQPAHGVAAKNADESITYTPTVNYSGSDSFTYTISDGKGGSATATVNLTINPVTAQKATITIVHSATPKVITNFRFSGSLGPFYLDDPAVNDSDNYTTTKRFEVNAGLYTVTETVPSGWYLQSLTCVGTTSALVNGSSVAITAGAGQQITCSFVNARFSTVNAFVYNDLNRSGTRNGSEPYLSDWQVGFSPVPDGLVITLTTASAGKVIFGKVRSGNYKLCEDVKLGWQATQPKVTPPCHALTVTPGVTISGYFGNAITTSLSGETEESSGEVAIDVMVTEKIDPVDDNAGYEIPLDEGEESASPEAINLFYLPLVQK